MRPVDAVDEVTYGYLEDPGSVPGSPNGQATPPGFRLSRLRTAVALITSVTGAGHEPCRGGSPVEQMAQGSVVGLDVGAG